MKLSTINWLSRAIVLPLFIVTANIAPASAEQIGRSRRIESLPSVKNLNLSIPVPAVSIDSTESQESISVTPYWSNSRSSNGSTTVVKERNNKPQPIPKVKRKLSANEIAPANPAIDRSSAIKTIVKRKLAANPIAPANPVFERYSAMKLTSNRKKILATKIDLSLEKTPKDSYKAKSTSIRRIATGSRPLASGNYFKLVKATSLGTNEVGNPIYMLEAYVDGRKYRTFPVVSGTANTQTVDRHIGNNSAPLPDGIYEVSSQVIPGTTPEVGDTFVGIFPRFETKRNGLGIHLDRSFNKRNGYDGTSGCIGITTLLDRDAINNFVTKYHPHSLFVSIITPSDRY